MSQSGPVDPSSAATSPPGWYPDRDGALRWWDGWSWGPAAPPSTNRTLAIITHLGPILGGFLLPLLVYLLCDKNDRFVRHHAAEALNFSITLLLVQLGGSALALGGFVVLAGGLNSGGAVAGFGVFVLVWVAFAGIVVASWVFAVIAAVAASRGEWYRYPVNIRFVKGGEPKGTPPVTF
jgi:uncharacterized Tic20 family protein